jgi:hypothetical protein
MRKQRISRGGRIVRATRGVSKSAAPPVVPVLPRHRAPNVPAPPTRPRVPTRTRAQRGSHRHPGAPGPSECRLWGSVAWTRTSRSSSMAFRRVPASRSRGQPERPNPAAQTRAPRQSGQAPATCRPPCPAHRASPQSRPRSRPAAGTAAPGGRLPRDLTRPPITFSSTTPLPYTPTVYRRQSVAAVRGNARERAGTVIQARRQGRQQIRRSVTRR